MQLTANLISIKKPSFLSFAKPFKSLKPLHSLPNSQASRHQSETLKVLEWPTLCNHLSSFTSTSMAHSVAKTAAIPIGKTIEESHKLLNQTAAALSCMMESGPFDLSGVEDISGIIDSAVSGQLLTVRELCKVRPTLRAARVVLEKLNGDDSERYSPLLEILDSCNFQVELEKKIGFCLDCNLFIILDRASDELQNIRSKRKENMARLDNLLKEISGRVFQAGGIDRPLVTRRRSRLCVGVKASHKHLVSDGVVLDVSSSGVTYFVEPGEAVELNNFEVMLGNTERAEEVAILSFLSREIAESERDLKFLLNGIMEIDLAFARAGYAHWMSGVCPILTAWDCENVYSGEVDFPMSIDIEGIRHPLLLGSSQRNLSDALESDAENASPLDQSNGMMTLTNGSLPKIVTEFPVPIDIKVESRTRVIVISGPNTGGKTASMKTLGLAALMSKAGLYLPAKNNPQLPWFDLVVADIGDHQSLEQNLSTFSGHISNICKILEVATKESLVLIDEICSGTDPSEGVALSTSILEYLKDRVNLAVVTTHYADLSRLKDRDNRFENAAMEFSLETLQPTYQILWGSTGDSNALTISKSIGFDGNIIQRAQEWVEKLTPEKQQERKGMLYQSLTEERSRLEAQASRAASLHKEIMDLYNEIKDEAKDLDMREKALMAKETQQIRRELDDAKSQIQNVIHNFENQLEVAGPEQYNTLIRNSESVIASIVEAFHPGDGINATESDISSYTPQVGGQVHVKRLGNKLATVVEAPGDDETILVQYGKIRIRVKKGDIRATLSNKRSKAINLFSSRKQRQQNQLEDKNGEMESYGARVQTSKNTVDLRGMRVEEASLHLDMALSGSDSRSVIFVVHGTGTGAIKQCAQEILGKHPRVAKYEPESPLNYGCTVAYIK